MLNPLSRTLAVALALSLIWSPGVAQPASPSAAWLPHHRLLYAAEALTPFVLWQRNALESPLAAKVRRMISPSSLLLLGSLVAPLTLFTQKGEVPLMAIYQLLLVESVIFFSYWYATQRFGKKFVPAGHPTDPISWMMAESLPPESTSDTEETQEPANNAALTRLFLQETAQKISALVGVPEESVEQVLKDLPFETLQAAHGNRGNLRSPAYQKIFLSHWNRQDLHGALESLAAGVRSPVFTATWRVFLPGIPSEIQAEIPAPLQAELLRLQLFHQKKNSTADFISLQWQYFYVSEHLAFWLPVQADRITPRGELYRSTLLKFILHPSKSGDAIELVDVRSAKLSRTILRAEVEAQTGPLDPQQMPEQIHDWPSGVWVAGRLSKGGKLTLSADHVAPNGGTGHDQKINGIYEYDIHRLEPYIAEIGPDGLPLALRFLAAPRADRLEVALDKNERGQISALWESHAEISAKDHQRLREAHPRGYWVQGFVMGVHQVYLGQHRLAESPVPIRNQYGFPAPDFEGQPIEALMMERPVYLRAWAPPGVSTERDRFFTKNVEIRSSGNQTLEVIKTLGTSVVGLADDEEHYSAILPVALTRAAAAVDAPNIVVVTNNPPSVRRGLISFTVGGRTILIPVFIAVSLMKKAKNLKGLVAEVTYDPQAPHQNFRWPVPTRIAVGRYTHQDPNRIASRKFEPLETFDIHPPTGEGDLEAYPSSSLPEMALLDQSIFMIPGVPRQNLTALRSIGIETLGDLVLYPAFRLFHIEGIHRIGLEALQKGLSALGLSLPAQSMGVPERVRSKRLDEASAGVSLPKVIAEALLSDGVETIEQLMDSSKEKIETILDKLLPGIARKAARQKVRTFLKNHALPELGTFAVPAAQTLQAA